ncbi:MAG TPA: hypothetical protein VGF14_03525 [Alphaproteobacteria bacterium]
MQEDNLLNADAPANPPVEQKAKPNVPDKFWDKDRQEIRVDSLLKSYLELEKKLSADKKKNVPETPRDYQIKLDHDLFTADDEINERLHEAGFTDAQVQLVYDLAAEKMVPLIIELARDFEADREMEKLVKTFGGAEKWAAVSQQLLAFGQRHLPADVLTGLAGSYEGVMALYRLMQAGKPLNLQDAKGGGDALNEQGLKKMMQDPKYWRDKDADIVQKVTTGFKQIFNN